MKTRHIEIKEAWGEFIGIGKEAMEYGLKSDGWVPAAMLEPNLNICIAIFNLEVNEDNEYRPKSLA